MVEVKNIQSCYCLLISGSHVGVAIPEPTNQPTLPLACISGVQARIKEIRSKVCVGQGPLVVTLPRLNSTLCSDTCS